MNLVWAKLLVILACTLAGERDNNEFKEFAKHFGLAGINTSQWGVPYNSTADTRNHEDNVCLSSCSALESKVLLWHMVAPTPIAGCAWLVASFPTLLFRSRQRTLGVRACLWQLLLLWLSLVIAYAIFAHHRVLGYVWAVHASVHALSAWAPPRRVVVMPTSHRVTTFIGVLAVCGFAWHCGPPVGIIAWQGGWTSQCGLSSQFMAIMGVDFLGWLLEPVGGFIAGRECYRY
jgi:hypothetical protein